MCMQVSMCVLRKVCVCSGEHVCAQVSMYMQVNWVSIGGVKHTCAGEHICTGEGE